MGVPDFETHLQAEPVPLETSAMACRESPSYRRGNHSVNRALAGSKGKPGRLQNRAKGNLGAELRFHKNKNSRKLKEVQLEILRGCHKVHLDAIPCPCDPIGGLGLLLARGSRRLRKHTLIDARRRG